MNTPATPTPGRVRGFQRGSAPAAPAAPTTTSEQPTATAGNPASTDPASSEQKANYDHLTEIDYDAAANHSSAGLAKGEISIAKITDKGNGVWCGVRHCRDNTLGGMYFAIWREEKGKLDAEGKPVRTADSVGRKAWANFCKFFELDPREVMVKLGGVASGELPETENPLLGIVGMYKFKDGKDANAMMSAAFDEQATVQMRSADDAS